MARTFKLSCVAIKLRSIPLKLPTLVTLDLRRILDLLLKKIAEHNLYSQTCVSRCSISSSAHAKVQVDFSSKCATFTLYKYSSPLISIVVFKHHRIHPVAHAQLLHLLPAICPRTLVLRNKHLSRSQQTQLWEAEDIEKLERIIEGDNWTVVGHGKL
jgi:hypothetical protein